MKKLKIFDDIIDILEKEISKLEKEIDKTEERDIKKKSIKFYVSGYKKDIKILEIKIDDLKEFKKDLKDYYKKKKQN